MVDVSWDTFIGALAADTITGAEKVPMLDTDASTAKHITPDLVAAYTIDQLHGASVITSLGDTHQLSVFTTGDDEKIITFANVSAWLVDEIEAITTGTTIVSGDTLIYVDGGVLKQIDIDAIVSFVNSENAQTAAQLGAQISALSAATLADTDDYVLEQGGSALKTTFTALAGRVHDQLNTFVAGKDATVTPADADKLYILQGSTAKYVTLTVLANTYLAAELNLEDFVWATATTTPSLSGDMLLMERAGTITEVDIDTVQTYMASGLQASVLTFSGLAAATPNAADLFTVDDSGTAKKLTLTNLETKLWADFNTYVTSTLAENATAAGSDKFYCIQGGTSKWVDADTLATFFAVPAGDVVGPGSTTEDNIPQWDATTKNLKDGLTVVTALTAGAMTDSQVPTAQAVDEFVTGGGSLGIDTLTDLGEAIVDADLVIMDNGATGTNRKAAFSRIWTYITTKIQALTAKTTPVGADILTIQDSAASNALKEVTVTNLALNLHPSLATTAGAGITDAVASYVQGVEKIGTIFKTTIVMDITGLRSTAADDIIGDDGTASVCHIGQITAAVNGTVFAGRVTCLETPTGGDPDIDLYSATESTGVEDSAISLLTETLLLNAGDHAINAFKSLTAFPAANEYLYLVAGDTTDADYTAGILHIELWGK